MMPKLHPNIERDRRIEKLIQDATRYENEASDLEERAHRAKRQAESAVDAIKGIEEESLPPLETPDGLVHRVQTSICPGCGLADAQGHYDCRGSIPVPVVLYVPDMRQLLWPWSNPSVIPYQGAHKAVLHVTSVKVGTRRDAVREFGPESEWNQPSVLKESHGR